MSDWWQWAPEKDSNNQLGFAVVGVGRFGSAVCRELIRNGSDVLAVSNVIGSNIFNVLVVLGSSAIVMPLKVESRLVRRDVPLLIAVSSAVWGMAFGRTSLPILLQVCARSSRGDFPVLGIVSVLC